VRSRPKLLAPFGCVAATVTLVVLLNRHVTDISGPDYWRWSWQQVAWERVGVAFAIAAVPFVIGQWLVAARGWPERRALSALALSLLLLQLAAVGLRQDPFSLTMATRLVQAPGVTSYFTDAAALAARPHLRLSRWLADFPNVIGSLHLHSTTKPPGPILFYLALVRLFGPGEGAARAGAFLVALLTSLGVFAVYHFVRALSAQEDRGFFAASIYALTPGIAVIHPMFDQFLGLFTCAILGLWAAALDTRRKRLACASGLVLAGAAFFSYSLLTLGVFLTGYTVVVWAQGGAGRTRALLVQLAVAIGTVAFVFGVLWALTRYDPVASFRAAHLESLKFRAWLQRPYPRSIYWDLEDFFTMGVGWACLVLTVAGVMRRQPWRERAVALLGVVQIGVAAATGLLAGETARVFLFLVPLLAVPIDGALKEMRSVERWTVYACMLATTAAICRNVVFLGL
jgi:hypothetical protein